MQNWSVVLKVVKIIKSTLLLNGKYNVVATYNFKNWLEEFLICTDCNLNELVTVIKSIDKNLTFDETNPAECIHTLHDAIQYVKISQIAADESGFNKLPILNLKYGKEVTFGRLWNNFYMETRGIIIDLDRERVLSATANKFFNFGEYFLTPEYVKNVLERATSIEITDKEDGSMISVFDYNNTIMTATPGSMISSQAFWARSFLEKNHKQALETWRSSCSSLTPVFEAIYPENRVVRNYNGESKMVLTMVRNLETGEQLTYTAVRQLAQQFGFPTPKHENKTLEQLMEEAKDKAMHPADQKEGWVIRVDYQEDDGKHNFIMFKLKCEDYCILHKLIGDILNPKFVMEAVIEDKVDDVYAQIRNEDFKSIFLKLAQRFLEISNEKRKQIIEKWNSIPDNVKIPVDIVNRFKKLNFAIHEYLERVGYPENDRAGVRKLVHDTCRSASVGRVNYRYDKIVSEVRNNLPQDVLDQRDYFKYRGMFAQHVTKNIPKWYQGYMFAAVDHENPVQYLESVEPLRNMEANQIKIDDILAPVKNYDADA